MSEASLKYLETQWGIALKQKDWLLCGKILRSQINILKYSDGLLRDYKSQLAEKVESLEAALSDMDVEEALPLIGHIRHARKTLQLSSGSFGEAFRRELSSKERARLRKRNTAPKLSLQNRAMLGADFPVGSPSDVLLVSDLGNGE